MNAKNLAIVLFMYFLVQSSAFSQNRDTVASRRRDNVPARLDTTKTAAKAPAVVKDSARLALERMPRQAAMKSAMLPGLGQFYNKRWWKVPLIYGGFIGIGLVYEFNQRNYKIFLKEAQYRELNPKKTQNPLFAGYSSQGIITIKDSYRRDRDLSILAGLGFYAINIIDAYVDAKFFRFDISDELSLKVDPVINNGSYMNASAERPSLGIKFSLSL